MGAAGAIAAEEEEEEGRREEVFADGEGGGGEGSAEGEMEGFGPPHRHFFSLWGLSAGGAKGKRTLAKPWQR